MNKFAKYVPEELKKLQREHIGAAAEGEGGSGGVTSWNDLTDKPFEKMTVETSTIYNGVNVECWGDTGEDNFYFETDEVFSSIMPGHVYTVILNGVTYDNLLANGDEQFAFIGASADWYITVGLPFMAYTYYQDGRYWLRVMVHSSLGRYNNIKIIGPAEVVKTIDEMYLPEPLRFGSTYPFETIYWDGNLEGFETVSSRFLGTSYDKWVKISDQVLTGDHSMIYSYVKCVTNADTGENEFVEVLEEDIGSYGSWIDDVNGIMEWGGIIASVFNASQSAQSAGVTNGVWVAVQTDCYIASIKPREHVTHIDKKYMPIDDNYHAMLTVSDDKSISIWINSDVEYFEPSRAFHVGRPVFLRITKGDNYSTQMIAVRAINNFAQYEMFFLNPVDMSFITVVYDRNNETASFKK